MNSRHFDARTQLNASENGGPPDSDSIYELSERIDSLGLRAYGLRTKDVPFSKSKDGGSASKTEAGSDTGTNVRPVRAPSVHGANLLMWCVGVAFGRWDVRMARDQSLIPELQGPFDRLPQVAPGGLVGPDALPATRKRIASEAWLRARADVISLPEARAPSRDLTTSRQPTIPSRSPGTASSWTIPATAATSSTGSRPGAPLRLRCRSRTDDRG